MARARIRPVSISEVYPPDTGCARGCDSEVLGVNSTSETPMINTKNMPPTAEEISAEIGQRKRKIYIAQGIAAFLVIAGVPTADDIAGNFSYILLWLLFSMVVGIGTAIYNLTLTFCPSCRKFVRHFLDVPSCKHCGIHLQDKPRRSEIVLGLRTLGLVSGIAIFFLAAMFVVGRLKSGEGYWDQLKLSRGASQGNSEAMLEIGRKLHEGRGLSKDLDKAAAWYRKAAVRGNKEARKALAGLTPHSAEASRDTAYEAYLKGNFAAAERLWTYRARRGDIDAMFSLGELYSKGKGIPQDLGKAYKWFSLAAEREDKGALKRKKEIEALLFSSPKRPNQSPPGKRRP